MTAARDMLNQKYDTIGSHKLCQRNAMHQTTTCAETSPAQCISQGNAKAEYSQEGIWQGLKSKSKRNRNGPIANRISGRYVFHQNAEGTLNQSQIEDTCQQVYSQSRRYTVYIPDNRQKTSKPVRAEAPDRKEKAQKTSTSRMGKIYPSRMEETNCLGRSRRRSRTYHRRNQHTETTDTSSS